MNSTRRALLIGSLGSGTCLATALAQPLSPSHILEPVPNLAHLQLAVVQRRSVAGIAASDPVLVSFRKAITAMQALPASDPRSWENIAQVHNDHCAHRNWYTWPWHRAYLISFERICQQMSGDNSFRVPYWDWTANRQIPTTFMAQTLNGGPNALFHPRARSGTDSLPDAAVGPTVIDGILGEPNFEAFMSRRPPGQTSTAGTWQRVPSAMGPIESNPHNTIHGWIGDDMGTFFSPRDPIFWLHHANLDRLWDRWNRAGNANTTDPLWRDFTFSGQFVSRAGAPFNPKVSQLLDIRALGYTYVSPLVMRPPIAKFLSSFDWSKLQRVESGTNVVTAERARAADVTLLPPPALARAMQRAFLAAPAAVSRAQASPAGAAAQGNQTTTAGRVLALVDAELPKDAQSPVVRVFLNCDYLTPDTPNVDPHYVGSFSFFLMSDASNAGDMQGGRTSQVILDLTRTLNALAGAGPVKTDQIRLQFQPVPNGTSQEPSNVTIRRVEILAT